MNTKTATTAELIAEYDKRIAARVVQCQVGSSRWNSRQTKINEIVDELSKRADDGDEMAEEWYAN